MSTPIDNKFPSKRFGEKLRVLRKKHSITQAKLGNMVGVSDAYIRQLETSKVNPNVAMVLKLSLIFDVSTDVLIKDNLDLE